MEKIKQFDIIRCDDKILIGVSGGVDSMTLLYLLNGVKDILNIDIVCVTVDHGLRKESKEEINLVKEFSRSLDVPCISGEIDVLGYSKEKKLSIEEAARKLRYEFFYRIKEKVGASKIAVAHNLNDLVENVLFRLSRGAGPFGIYGMKPVKGNIIRPLLFFTREDIEDFAGNNKIPYAVDKSNFDTKYTRNFIRHNIIPKFKELNPSFERAVFRFVENLWELDDFMENTINVKHVKIFDGVYFKVPEDEYVLVEFVRRQTIEQLGIAPDKEKLDRLKRSLGNTTFKVSFWEDYGLEISYGYGFLGKFLNGEFFYEIKRPGKIFLEPFEIEIGKNDKDGIIFNKESFVIRNWKFGDKIKGGKKIKEIFVKKKVPSFIRRILPVFVDEDVVFFIPGIYIDKSYLSEKGLSVKVKGGFLF